MRYPAHSHLAVRTEAQFFRTKHCFKEEVLRPLSVTLIIPYPLRNNKFLCGALVKNTVNTLAKPPKTEINTPSYAIGRMYYRGIGVTQGLKKAAGYFAKAAEENVPYADYTLAQMAEAGQGMEKSITNAFVLYKKALSEFLEQEKQQPDPFTEFRIAKMYLAGNGTDINPAEGSKWLQKAVEGGNAQAEYELATMYNTGETIPKDEEKAAELFGKAFVAFISSDYDNPGAGQEYRIAQMYEKGMGTEQNSSEALAWFLKSADGKNAYAAYQAGKMLFEGQSVPQDKERAEKLYSDAIIGFLQIEKDKPNAQLEYRIASMYLNGIGTGANTQQALKWFSQSAENGNAFAAYQTAKILKTGTAAAPQN